MNPLASSNVDPNRRALLKLLQLIQIVSLFHCNKNEQLDPAAQSYRINSAALAGSKVTEACLVIICCGIYRKALIF